MADNNLKRSLPAVGIILEPRECAAHQNQDQSPVQINRGADVGRDDQKAVANVETVPFGPVKTALLLA